MVDKEPNFKRVPDNRLVPLCERFLFYEFFLLERHRREVAASLKLAAESREHFIEDLRARLEDDDPCWDSISEDHHELVTLLPRIQWNSQFVVAYGTFEHILLNEVCTRAQGRLGLSKSHKDYVRDRGIERAKVYLSKEGGINAPFNTPDWNIMRAFGSLRNFIAHSSGEVDLVDVNGKGNDLRLQIRKWPGIDMAIDETGERGYVELTSEFVRFAIEAMQRFTYSVANVEVKSA